MKKLLFTLLIAILALTSTAQITVNVTTAGGFSTALSNAGGNANTVTNLIVTGYIDARDVKFMRDNMPVLAILDLSAVQIIAYSGTGGTNSGSISYPSNEMPEYSFYISGANYGKTSLKSLKFPYSITSIGRYACTLCIGLTGSLVIPNSVTSIGDYAFRTCNGFNNSLTFGNSVSHIGNYAFMGCYKFSGNLIIPNKVTYIGNGAFYDCSGFTGNLSIPNSVTYIGYSAFIGCSGFTGNLNIPNSVNSIGELAFWGCSGFTNNLSISNSVTSIGDGAFANCSNITSITVNDDNPNFSVIDGVLFNKAKTKLIQCPAGKIADSYIIPNSVTSIWNYSFNGCYKLTGSLRIPNSVSSIGYEAFTNCDGFKGGLSFSSSLLSIGTNAFYGCSGFTGDLVIPNSVTSIDNGAFSGCSGFNGSLIIPNSVISIGDWTFSNCNNLQRIIVAQTIPLSIYQYTFSDVNKTTCKLIVPIGSKTAYQTANYWKDFFNIIEGFFVHFDSKGGTLISDINTNFNTNIAAPNPPIKPDNNFLGWYKEEACTNAWNFASDLITDDITLYAKWTATSTAIANIDDSNLKMFPNPAGEFVKIEGEKLQTVTFYTLKGATIQQINLHGEESTNINLNHLSSGYYHVKVKTSNEAESIMKLVKK